MTVSPDPSSGDAPPPASSAAPQSARDVPHMGDDEPQSERLSFARNELAMVLSHYDLGIIESIRPLQRGSRQSPKLVIRTTEGAFLLKRRAPGRDRPRRVAFTHSLMVHLFEQNYPTPRLIGTRDDNNSMLQHAGTVYEMFTFIEGSRYPRSEKSARHAGIAHAHLHRLLRSFKSTFESPMGGYHAYPDLDQRMAAIPNAVRTVQPDVDMTTLTARLQRLDARYREARERVDQLGFASTPDGVGHGDWHPGNVLYRGSAVAAVLDYDSARREPYISDIANGLLQFTMHIGTSRDPDGWPIGLDDTLVTAFWGGYDEMSGGVTDRAARAMIPWLIIEALIVESVLPISATGTFGRMAGETFLRIIDEQVDWVLA
ncbi:MAG: phosphotransferase, partial [Phycisphaerales bacterium]|nr:phosphotransferase [Phycisphaerales bacterium]